MYIHFAVHLKLIQHCKPTILQLKKKKKNTRKMITLNVNGWNSIIKRHWMTECIKLKNRTQLCAAFKRLSSALSTHIGSKWRNGKKLFHASGKQKRAGVCYTSIKQNIL